MLDSPVDDFVNKTLRAIPGTLGKLEYLAGLRQGNGEYFHWGMARTHGEASASLAIGQAHTDIFLSVLREPIRSLWEEADGLARNENGAVNDYVRKLAAQEERLVPAHLQGGERRHFTSVLVVLCYLAGMRASKTDRDA